MFVGSPSWPVGYTRVVLFDPTVTNFVPSGVYAQNVGPEVCAGRGLIRTCVVVAIIVVI